MSNRKQWSFEDGDGAISEVGTDDIIMYIDDISPLVIAGIVEKWNAGKTVEEILKVVYKDTDNVTPDQYDYIAEQINAFISLVSTEVPETIIDIPEEQTASTPAVDNGALVQGAVTTGSTPPVVTPERKQRAPNKPKTTSKAVSAAEVIASLQEKLELTQYIGNITVEDVPVGTKMSAKGREVLTGINKAIENLIVEAILTIIVM